ncbi:unnamed protein product, partial [Nesidiocoris tenuis]
MIDILIKSVDRWDGGAWSSVRRKKRRVKTLRRGGTRPSLPRWPPNRRLTMTTWSRRRRRTATRLIIRTTNRPPSL